MPESYWDSYRDTQSEFYQTLRSVTPEATPEPVIGLRYACVYCHEVYPSLKDLQFHYRMRGVGEDSTLIPQSIRGAASEAAWKKNCDAVSAPTIRSVSA